MKKLSVKFTYDQLQALDSWLDDHLHAPCRNHTYMYKCQYAVLKEWQLSKVKAKLHYRFPKQAPFKLGAAVGCALADLIYRVPVSQASYTGSMLLMLQGHIDQTFK
jgi:hypothetical protein